MPLNITKIRYIKIKKNINIFPLIIYLVYLLRMSFEAERIIIAWYKLKTFTFFKKACIYGLQSITNFIH